MVALLGGCCDGDVLDEGWVEGGVSAQEVADEFDGEVVSASVCVQSVGACFAKWGADPVNEDDICGGCGRVSHEVLLLVWGRHCPSRPRVTCVIQSTRYFEYQ